MGISTAKPRSEQLAALRRFMRHKPAVAGAIVVCFFILVALTAPWLASHDPLAISISDRLQGPSLSHYFGTDELGRDVYSRVVFGSRISLQVGMVAVAIGLAVGGLLGAIAGFFKRLDNVIMRVVDVLLAFPSILLAIAVVAILGPALINLMIAVGIRTIPSFARLVRSAVLQVSELDYTHASTALGATRLRVLFRTVIPNSLPPVLVFSTMELAKAILLGAILSFLGLGPEPPTPEWGRMVSDARGLLRVAPHVALFPGFTILVLMMGFNLLGDGLRDTFDPRQSNK